MKNLYAVLDVSKDATPEEIKKAYKILAKKWHPDLHNGDKNVEEIFKNIQAAYEILSDPDKRKVYDETGSTDDMNPDEASIREEVTLTFLTTANDPMFDPERQNPFDVMRKFWERNKQNLDKDIGKAEDHIRKYKSIKKNYYLKIKKKKIYL